MSRDDFMRYLEENFHMTGALGRMVINILDYAEGFEEEDLKYGFLCDMFDNTIGISKEEILMVKL